MSVTERDRKALKLLAVVVPVFLIAYWLTNRESTATVEIATTAPQAQLRLNSLRRKAAGMAALEESRKKVGEAVAAREKGMIRAETAAQAQAQLLQVVRRVMNAQQPPLAFRASEMGAPRRLSDDYGEVTASISMECGIEQIVNLLSDLANQPELIATRELQFGMAREKQKVVPLRLTVAAIVDPKLVPEKKEGQLF